MGSESKESSNSSQSSSAITDSYNQIVSATLGQEATGVTLAGGSSFKANDIFQLKNSLNPITTTNTTNSLALGANSSSSPMTSTEPSSSSGFDLMSLLPYAFVGGFVLLFIYLMRNK